MIKTLDSFIYKLGSHKLDFFLDVRNPMTNSVAFKDVAGVNFLLDIIEAGVVAVIRFHFLFFQGAHDLMIRPNLFGKCLEYILSTLHRPRLNHIGWQ